ncbi:hypothetical protein ACS0X5_37620, partial [Burkholderia gladioli]|uniref:hypothetical protein n=2 Tax=Burkholderia gladioli TaxID=28095 RepID=UPI003F7AF870
MQYPLGPAKAIFGQVLPVAHRIVFLQCNDLFGQFLHTLKGLLESGLLTRNCCSATEQGINALPRVCTSFERVLMFV